MNRGGDLSSIYKMILFVECCEDLLLMPHSFENTTAVRASPGVLKVAEGFLCSTMVCGEFRKTIVSASFAFLSRAMAGIRA
jgi:hypothetical protein